MVLKIYESSGHPLLVVSVLDELEHHRFVGIFVFLSGLKIFFLLGDVTLELYDVGLLLSKIFLVVGLVLLNVRGFHDLVLLRQLLLELGVKLIVDR